jgi:hypothetical protein
MAQGRQVEGWEGRAAATLPTQEVAAAAAVAVAVAAAAAAAATQSGPESRTLLNPTPPRAYLPHPLAPRRCRHWHLLKRRSPNCSRVRLYVPCPALIHLISFPLAFSLCGSLFLLLTSGVLQSYDSIPTYGSMKNLMLPPSTPAEQGSDASASTGSSKH